MLKKIKAKLAAGSMAIVPTCPATGCGWAELLVLFQNLIKFGIYIGGILVGVSIIFGGFLVLTSAGDESRVTRGRHAITSAVVGFAIVLSAWLIVNTIITIFIPGCSGQWNVFGGQFGCH